ncbi:Integral membrane protein SED5 [Tilletia horrida]|uniref:Integral membrane protein SED5 n=1 Tax=Tilletia horrida TaxID=155126 RepID=A0AAN6K0G9_9BASI|nr:Integral membrane protein SED5 [Tilletia horrida]KAK0556833.1 Integral membrane protein SED5 [Tilletia horrida]KAK0569230.1 Integral membrane protein SED5 [Tilletia horrida]
MAYPMVHRPFATSPRDRTAEFHAAVSHLRQRNAGAPGPRQTASGVASSSAGAIGGGSGANGSGAAGKDGKSNKPRGKAQEFAVRAGAIAKDISSTTAKLERLAQLARRKNTLFDDRPVEISELTYIIKHDIAAINKQLADLQNFNRSNAGGAGGSKDKGDEHRGNVVTLLQSKLAGATTDFQDILEVRTQNMKASRERTDQFVSGAPGGLALGPGDNSVLRSRKQNVSQSSPSTYPQPYGTDSPLYNPNGAAGYGGGAPAVPAAGRSDAGGYSIQDEYDPKGKGKANTASGDFLALDMGYTPSGPGAAQGQGGQYMQMQLMEQNQDNSYIQQRSSAIESIESTISELGQIFGQLAQMVAEQRETVQRIDENVNDVVDNVGGAQRELLKYYASVSSNRWLMLKIFGVLIVFFLVFILVS